jgi:hypothetical protein
MRPLLRLAGIFIALCAGAACAIALVLPRLFDWHSARCAHDPLPSIICRISAPVLSYWWLALIPALVAATAIINRWIAR